MTDNINVASIDPAIEARSGDRFDNPENDLAWRIVNSTNFIRLALATLLLGIFIGASDPRIVGSRLPLIFSICVVAFLIYALLSVVLIRGRVMALRLQIIQQITVDISATIVLMHASGGINSGIGGLLVVFVAAALLAQPGRTPFFLPAVAAIALLAEQAFSQLSGTTTGSEYTATGILGAILFAIPMLTGPLAKRLSESEALARQRGVDLANMSRLNQYIVQHLRESIVAIDGDDVVRLLNESAAQMLRTAVNANGLPLSKVSPALADRVREWRASNTRLVDGELSMTSPDDGAVININIAPLDQGQGGPSPALIFMEDTSILAERVQQSKLASLGRLSASIAHEIRNPVGAMSHAGQLLAESGNLDDTKHRLIDIIVAHSTRVSNIIENILQLSRRETGKRERLELTPWLRQFAGEFTQTLELNESELTIAKGTEELEVLMDPSHLRQILWNLCDNAVKYASDSGGILVELTPGRLEASGRPYLDISDSGSGVDPALVENIFEPFFTAQKGGTGLGLYISRELCELNGAALSYRAGLQRGSIFRIVFADPARWARTSRSL